MSDDNEPFLARWSRRKLETREEITQPPPELDDKAQPPVAAGGASGVEAPPAPILPAVEDLTPESDFKPFMGANVAPETRQAALKKLFADPHYNVPEQFEAYMGDYSKEDPIPLEMLKRLDHARHVLFDEKDKVPQVPAERQVQAAEAQPEPVNGAAGKDA